MRAPSHLPVLVFALAAAGCGDELVAAERLSVPLPAGGVAHLALSNTTAEVQVRGGHPPALVVWVEGHGAEVVDVTLQKGRLNVREACEGCVLRYEVVVPPSAALSVNAHRADLKVMDLDGAVTAEVLRGDVRLVGLAGTVEVDVVDGDLVASGMWSSRFAAQVAGHFDGVWTRPPSALSVDAGGDLRASLATYFYSAELEAEGALSVNDFVDVPGSPHHLALSSGGDLSVDFGPAQGAEPPRR
jgi:hypothetical protein